MNPFGSFLHIKCTIPNLQRSGPQHSRPLILCHIRRGRPLVILYSLFLQPQHSIFLYLLPSAFPIHLYHRPGCRSRAIGHLRVWILGAKRTWRWGSGGCWEIRVFGVLGLKFGLFLVEGGLVSFVAVGDRDSAGRFDVWKRHRPTRRRRRHLLHNLTFRKDRTGRYSGVV